ncbi:hypothetical protein FA13DRAFT_1730187 [Coprinellus micaceus]|uniref:MFS general substrate transporter n=1 Tax=Coprinellus micaceus TaxID=71717 RepID=A0A4Y7TK28_COPMI|nr:hypothetical protein FA13DRAFT_1730187 [Coprinellus micaceus]
MSAIAKAWHNYTSVERRNIAIYIAGIMCYKLGLEFFNGSITTLATDRFNAARTFTKLGAAQGLNQAAQCVGGRTRTVLSIGIIMFAVMTALLLIIRRGYWYFKDTETNTVRYGSWPPNLIFLIWTVSGICYGMVELIRRVIPADIVGGNVNKLRRMDALVVKIAGTSGAFASSSAISRWGNNYSFFLTPIFFAIAGLIWIFISVLNFDYNIGADEELEQAGLSNVERSKQPSTNYLVLVFRGFLNFGESIWVGAKLIFTNRCFIWLLPAYSIALYLHRFLENSLAPAFAKRVLETSAWSQIIVGGSNFGELLGAAAVLWLSSRVPTPIPWLRFDALALNIVWVLPAFAKIATKDVTWAWKIAGCFIPISMGWAAGDVSLAAYIQSTLSQAEYQHPRVSPLGAVMAFLYATYIVLNAVLSTVLGTVFDADTKKNGKIYDSLITVGGVHFTVASAIVLGSTFIPRGALAFNPKQLGTIEQTRPHPVYSEDGSEPNEKPGDEEYNMKTSTSGKLTS